MIFTEEDMKVAAQSISALRIICRAYNGDVRLIHVERVNSWLDMMIPT